MAKSVKSEFVLTANKGKTMNEIKRLITIQRNVLKLIFSESKKKKTINLHIRFLLHLGVQYCRVMVREYKNLFLILDPVYRKRLKEQDKYNRIRKDLQRAIKLLKYIDMKMHKQGISRQRRRQFWRDFYSSEQIRMEIFEDLMKEIK
jgi:hypothetical protein